MEFQITQIYGDGCKGYIYFNIDNNASEEEIKNKAIDEMNKDWNNINPALYFSAPKPARPTIIIKEYRSGVTNGIKLKTKWR